MSSAANPKLFSFTRNLTSATWSSASEDRDIYPGNSGNDEAECIIYCVGGV